MDRGSNGASGVILILKFLEAGLRPERLITLRAAVKKRVVDVSGNVLEVSGAGFPKPCLDRLKKILPKVVGGLNRGTARVIGPVSPE